MSKTRIRNTKSLQYWVDRARLDSRDNATKTLELYKSGKIRDVTTARNLLEQFAATNAKTRAKATQRLQKIQDNLEKHGLISQSAIRKKKLREAKKTAQYSAKVVLYEINKGEKENKEIAETTKTKYFKGLRQTYTGTVLLTIPGDKIQRVDELFEQVKGKLLKKEEDGFHDMIDALSTNPDIKKFFEEYEYDPDALVLIHANKVVTDSAKPHDPLEKKRKDTQHIGINSRYCLTQLDFSQDSFEKAIYNSK